MRGPWLIPGLFPSYGTSVQPSGRRPWPPRRGGQPYLSLMAFAVTPDLKTIIVATDRGARKYANLKAEPRVALLIDNRSNTPADTQEAVAITVLDQAMEATPEEREGFLRLFGQTPPS